MSEIANAMRIFSGRLPTVILQINHPIHNGKPNPKHGQFFFSGSIPASCYDQNTRRSLVYPTEQAAIDAAIGAGVTHLQGVDCRKIVWQD